MKEAAHTPQKPNPTNTSESQATPADSLVTQGNQRIPSIAMGSVDVFGALGDHGLSLRSMIGVEGLGDRLLSLVPWGVDGVLWVSMFWGQGQSVNKVAVFGNAGGGKSTLSKHLEEMTGLPMVALDLLKYKPGGGEVPYKEYKAAHDQLLQQDQWIIDGYGSLDTVWERLEVADTLVYVDMPVLQHYWWVTKRFLKGFLVPPENWPENSPLLKGALNSYYTVWLCNKKLTPKYREYVNKAKENKRVYHLQSPKHVKEFYRDVELELEK